MKILTWGLRPEKDSSDVDCMWYATTKNTLVWYAIAIHVVSLQSGFTYRIDYSEVLSIKYSVLHLSARMLANI